MSWEEYTSRSNDDDGESEFSMVMMTYLIIMTSIVMMMTSLIMMMTSLIMMMTSIIMMMTSLIMIMTSKAGTGHWQGEDTSWIIGATANCHHWKLCFQSFASQSRILVFQISVSDSVFQIEK